MMDLDKRQLVSAVMASERVITMKATITVVKGGKNIAIGSFDIADSMTIVQRENKPELEFLALTDFILTLGGEEFVPALYNVPVDKTVHLKSYTAPEIKAAKVKVTGRMIRV